MPKLRGAERLVSAAQGSRGAPQRSHLGDRVSGSSFSLIEPLLRHARVIRVL